MDFLHRIVDKTDVHIFDELTRTYPNISFEDNGDYWIFHFTQDLLKYITFETTQYGWGTARLL